MTEPSLTRRKIEAWSLDYKEVRALACLPLRLGLDRPGLRLLKHTLGTSDGDVR